jgi:hypothetical protein
MCADHNPDEPEVKMRLVNPNKPAGRVETQGVEP